jgi:hypothetical protein
LKIFHFLFSEWNGTTGTGIGVPDNLFFFLIEEIPALVEEQAADHKQNICFNPRPRAGGD